MEVVGEVVGAEVDWEVDTTSRCGKAWAVFGEFKGLLVGRGGWVEPKLKYLWATAGAAATCNSGSRTWTDNQLNALDTTMNNLHDEKDGAPEEKR